jgi:hypothetical protein
MVSSEGVPESDPAIKGVWNGVGLALPGAMTGRNAAVTVETEFPLAQGDYTLDAALDIAPFDPARGDTSGSVSFSSNDQPLSPAVVLADVASAAREGQLLAWHAPLRHAGGPLRLRVRVEVSSTLDRSSLARLWLSDLRVE